MVSVNKGFAQECLVPFSRWFPPHRTSPDTPDETSHSKFLSGMDARSMLFNRPGGDLLAGTDVLQNGLVCYRQSKTPANKYKKRQTPKIFCLKWLKFVIGVLVGLFFIFVFLEILTGVSGCINSL